MINFNFMSVIKDVLCSFVGIVRKDDTERGSKRGNLLFDSIKIDTDQGLSLKQNMIAVLYKFA